MIGLAIITFGIYGIFWYYYANKELAEIGKAHNTDELGTHRAHRYSRSPSARS